MHRFRKTKSPSGVGRRPDQTNNTTRKESNQAHRPQYHENVENGCCVVTEKDEWKNRKRWLNMISTFWDPALRRVMSFPVLYFVKHYSECISNWWMTLAFGWVSRSGWALFYWILFTFLHLNVCIWICYLLTKKLVLTVILLWWPSPWSSFMTMHPPSPCLFCPNSRMNLHSQRFRKS